jgi:hypothetical protein
VYQLRITRQEARRGNMRQMRNRGANLPVLRTHEGVHEIRSITRPQNYQRYQAATDDRYTKDKRMNALDRLMADVKEKPDAEQTAIEKLILACRDDATRLQAAAEYMQMTGRVQYRSVKDVSEVNHTDVDPTQVKQIEPTKQPKRRK